MIESEWIPCKTCGNPTTFLGTKLCNGCWEVQTRLSSYLNNENAIQIVSKALNEAEQGTPAEDQHGREPDKVKPLAQYLVDYLQHEFPVGFNRLFWRRIIEQALDAYQSTENVTIKIERV